MAGQVWSVAADGGYLYSDNLSKKLRTEVQPMARYRQNCDAKDATDMGYGRGSIYNWNKFSKVATEGGELNESDKMPETKFLTIQASLKIKEWGNSIKKLVAFFLSIVDAFRPVVFRFSVA